VETVSKVSLRRFLFSGTAYPDMIYPGCIVFTGFSAFLFLIQAAPVINGLIS